MPDLHQVQRLKSVEKLNAQPQAVRLKALLTKAKQTPKLDSLMLTQALEWGADNLVGNPAQAEAVRSLVLQADAEDPEALASNLDVNLDEATTLEDAVWPLLQQIADWMAPQ